MTQIIYLKQFKENELDNISPTMCYAKWSQTTLHLHNGLTHSCHHPVAHSIPKDNLLTNPSSLNNTPQKMFERQQLLNGVQTPECDYCWRIENLGGDHVSDRVYKSSFSWSKPFKDDILASGLGANFAPSYVEISFENTCNLRCMYCSPEFSSRWIEDIRSNGEYKLHDRNLHNLDYLKSVNRLPYDRDEHNPYIDAFWKWWPDLYPQLHTFRVTGGEPLLSKHMFSILDWIIENPREELTLAINSNLSVPDKLMDTFIEKIKIVQHKVAKIHIFTSFEAVGKQAEYIRDGLDYSKMVNNVERILAETDQNKVIIGIMTTIVNLSVTTFDKFLKQLYNWKVKYSHRDVHRIQYPLTYLRYPDFLDVRNLPIEMKAVFEQKLRNFAEFFMKDCEHYYPEDFDQIERLISYMNSSDVEDCHKQNFKHFIREFDTRRNKSFIEVFPELKSMIK